MRLAGHAVVHNPRLIFGVPACMQRDAEKTISTAPCTTYLKVLPKVVSGTTFFSLLMRGSKKSEPRSFADKF